MNSPRPAAASSLSRRGVLAAAGALGLGGPLAACGADDRNGEANEAQFGHAGYAPLIEQLAAALEQSRTVTA